MPGTNEAFSRVKIDAQFKDQGWDVLNPNDRLGIARKRTKALFRLKDMPLTGCVIRTPQKKLKF